MPVLIPPEKVAEILTSADIVEIISETIALKKAGKDFVGLCPFHSEKTPSFTVSPSKQIFHCFGCHEGGNALGFVMRRDGMSFVEAARYLAERYGIVLPSRSAAGDSRPSEKDRLIEINAKALTYFRRCLSDRRGGGRAVDYLRRRGLGADTIERFQLGFAPDAWEGLIGFFGKNSAVVEMLVKAGLVVAREGQKGHYDRFRDRVMFPIWDHRGQVIAFGGRVMGDGQPKYLNSPETPLFQKRRTLYGFHLARQACRSAQHVFIVEGYLDLIALHQAGIHNAVATLGTALSVEQVQLLRGLMGEQAEAILVYDGDEAGVNAARRGTAIFNQSHLQARILVLPDGHDPDSFIREKGGQAFVHLAQQASDSIAFLLAHSIDRHGLTTHGKIAVVDEMAGVLAGIKDPLALRLYAKEIAERMGVAEDLVTGRIARTTDDVSVPAGQGAKTRRQDELQVIAMILQFPQLAGQIDTSALEDVLEDQDLKKIAAILLKAPAGQREHMGSVIQTLGDADHLKLVTGLAINQPDLNQQTCLDAIMRFVEKRRKRIQVADLDEQIRTAEQKQDYDRLVHLLGRRQKMAVQRQRARQKNAPTHP